MPYWKALIAAAVEEYGDRKMGAMYEGDGEYYQDMKASRLGFVTGISVMERAPPRKGETQEAYIERIQAQVRPGGGDVIAFINTLRRKAGMDIIGIKEL